MLTHCVQAFFMSKYIAYTLEFVLHVLCVYEHHANNRHTSKDSTVLCCAAWQRSWCIRHCARAAAVSYRTIITYRECTLQLRHTSIISALSLWNKRRCAQSMLNILTRCATAVVLVLTRVQHCTTTAHRGGANAWLTADSDAPLSEETSSACSSLLHVACHSGSSARVVAAIAAAAPSSSALNALGSGSYGKSWLIIV
jgi:hypothetical protein